MVVLSINNNLLSGFDWQDLSSRTSYDAWKIDKIKTFASVNAAVPIEVESLESAPQLAVNEIKKRCASMNFALYESIEQLAEASGAVISLKNFVQKFGLSTRENHRSMDGEGVVTLKTSSEEGKRGYIPYTPRPLNWHTDGYYNDSKNSVLAFVLHCFVPAAQGGENQIVDPEIAYMRMRDENPAFVKAFFHPEAMTIPENVEKDGSVRQASVGPVFFIDKETGRLQMRYTARTRSIEWRDDPDTLNAVAWMRDWLESKDEYVFTHQLKAGQGILTNNVLHNRTGFVDDRDASKHRIMMRMRFHNRISEE